MRNHQASVLNNSECLKNQKEKKPNNWKKIVGIKISAQPHTIVKQIKSVVPKAIYCFCLLFSLSKKCKMKIRGCANILLKDFQELFRL